MIFSLALERSVWNSIDVGYVPNLSYNLISLAKIVEAGHKYSGDDPGLTVHLKTGENLPCPVVGDMYISYGRRVNGDDIEYARAVIASGLVPTTDVDIQQYHRTTAHRHPRLLRESAWQQGVKLKPGVKLLPWVGCSTAKGFSAPAKKTTECRSTLPAPAEGGEDDDTAVGRARQFQVVGGMMHRTAMTTSK